MRKKDTRQGRSKGAWRLRRVAKGLPKYTEAERRWDRERNRLRRATPEYRERERERDRRRRLAQSDRRSQIRERIRAIKIQSGCVDCGYKGHYAALHFDHLPGFQKLFDLSDPRLTSNWDRIRAEIDKCEVVCANCHAIRTAERWEDKGAAKAAQPAVAVIGSHVQMTFLDG